MAFYSSTVDAAGDQVTNVAGHQPTATISGQSTSRYEGALSPRQIVHIMTGNFLKEIVYSTVQATAAVEFYDNLPGCSGRAMAAAMPDAEGAKVLRAGVLLNQEMEAAVSNYIKTLREVGFLVFDDNVEEGSNAPKSSNNVASAAVDAPVVADGAIPSTSTSVAAPQKRKAPAPRRGSAKKRKASPEPKGPMQRVRFVNEEAESSSASECINVRFRKVHHFNPDPCEDCRLKVKCLHFPIDYSVYTSK